MSATHLKRSLGLPGALMMGLGSMVGTGVFVSIGLGAGVAGPGVLPAIIVAAVVALCNGMSSAQLAAAHPVSGGTYEYGYRFLTPWLGFTAGWLFLCAKSASAATAALGFSGYLLYLMGIADHVDLRIPALVLLLGMTLLVASGIKRTSSVNTVVVSMTLLTLVLFMGTVLNGHLVVEHIALSSSDVLSRGFLEACALMFVAYTGLTLVLFMGTVLNGHLVVEHIALSSSDVLSRGFLEACALMFVAYTGYGRIATMGEEIKEPTRNIPKAILLVMAITVTLYLGVAFTAVGALGSEVLGELTQSTAAPLEMVLKNLNKPMMAKVVAVGALTAMAGVLLNLVLGLSRVLLAMGRRKDMPSFFSKLKGENPCSAVFGVGVLIGVIAMTGSVKLSWSFSAFTVLMYYALTNLAALRLPPRLRLYPRAFSYCGLAACVFLAFQVPVSIWGVGLAFLGLGVSIHLFVGSLRRPA